MAQDRVCGILQMPKHWLGPRVSDTYCILHDNEEAYDVNKYTAWVVGVFYSTFQSKIMALNCNQQPCAPLGMLPSVQSSQPGHYQHWQLVTSLVVEQVRT